MRRSIQGAAVCACASIVVAATPAAGVPQRTVTIAVSGSGKAFWKLDSSRETARLTLTYHWRGTLRFTVPVGPLLDRQHRRLSAASAGTLVATWRGRYSSRQGDTRSTCRYRGANARARVTAKLARGRAAKTLELTLHPRGAANGFFPDKSPRAFVRCSAGYVQTAPPHFAPSWFFRDNLQDHGRLTSDTAVIVIPGTLLPHGSATVAFPSERGRNDSVAVGYLAWNNRGSATARAR